ncbi:hypothetical protein ARMGADRAFT_1022929 [Armillaria gallica]|uniref:Uncharacterized protein n=1 Tax=Armillaria gallica TaxID=47427 RepID=A0A2H3EAU4_ARMGA|nr:hypothetical protein ARMGADRAFT_1022929 [Armillaria gallica]
MEPHASCINARVKGFVEMPSFGRCASFTYFCENMGADMEGRNCALETRNGPHRSQDVAPSIGRMKNKLKPTDLSVRKIFTIDIPVSEYSCPSPARPSYSTYTKGLTLAPAQLWRDRQGMVTTIAIARHHWKGGFVSEWELSSQAR